MEKNILLSGLKTNKARGSKINRKLPGLNWSKETALSRLRKKRPLRCNINSFWWTKEGE